MNAKKLRKTVEKLLSEDKNEEINKILANMQDSVDNPTYEQRVYGSEDYVIVDNDYCLTPIKCKVLLDYITNLQKENEKSKKQKKEAINYILNNKLYTFKYDDEELFEITTDKIAKDKLLKILGGDKDEQ